MPASSESSTGGTAPISRESLAARLPIRRIVGRNVSKADVLVYEIDGRRIALKDYGGRPLWSRNTAGRWLVAREARAYRAARGVAGVAEFLGTVGPFALATSWIEGSPLAESVPGDLRPGTLESLDRIVRDLHDSGVALGDLHHRDVIVASDGAVRIVDLATAWTLGERPGPFRRWLFRRLSDVDRISLARLRARMEGRDVDAAISEAGEAAARWHARGRRIKAVWDRLRGRR